ncbi:MAG: amino acid kinase family protein, partial [Promethearchaeota archaeon]
LIPGGGAAANFIRKLYRYFNFTEDVAHWMGIFSMNYNGIELSKKFPHIKYTESSRKLKKETRSFNSFLPFQFLKKKDELPHSWEVTSDSIALYLTKKLGINMCILIKEVEGILNNNNQVIREISTSQFNKMRQSGEISEFETNNNHLKALSRPVDPYLLSLINKYKTSCIILNGTSKKRRILEFFDESISPEEKICTVIKSI